MARELGQGTVLHRRYKIEALISKSGKAHTYRAADTRFPDRRWIVKIFESAPKKNFEDEMRLFLGLSHPNVVPVVDYFEEDGRFAAVEEWTSGESLEERLSRGSRPVERQIVSWGVQTVDAFLYLHERLANFRGYRDFSPRKMIITETGEVKIIPSFSGLWDESSGIIGYTAPEIFNHDQPPDERTDVYSIGAALHRAFVGEFHSQIPFVFPPISSENPNLHSPIEHVLERATEDDPVNRFQSLIEFREELMRCLDAIFAAHEKHDIKRNIPLALEWIVLAVLIGLGLGKLISKSHFSLAHLFHLHGH